MSCIRPLPEWATESASAIRRKAELPRPNDSRTIARPEVKLRGILEITRALGGQLEVDAVLPKLLSTLFNIFPLADQGFVLLKDSDSDKLKVKAITIMQSFKETR